MYCKNCGKEVDSSYEYCPYCGTKADLSEAPNKKKEECFSDLPLDKPVDYSKASGWWCVLGILCPIVGLIMYILKVHERPNLARKAGIGAFVGTIVYFILFAVLLTIFIIGVATGEPIIGGVIFY